MFSFILSTEKLFAWLLRDDVRNGADLYDTDAQQRFCIWWILHAPEDYPVAAQTISENDIKALSDIVAPPVDGDVFPLTRLMDYIWRIREDAHPAYPYRRPGVQRSFIRWFFTYGAPEHSLFPYLPEGYRAYLQSPAMNLPEAIEPRMNVLQALVWECRDDLRSAYDLQTLQSRMQFLGWYYCQGLQQLKHLPYYHKEDLEWLYYSHPIHHNLTWLAVLAWTYYSNDKPHLCQLISNINAFDILNWFHNTARSLYSLDELAAPACVRRILPEKVVQTAAQRPRPFGVNIVGFARGELGIGEDSRMAAQALEAAGIPFCVVNISTGENTRQEDRSLDARLNEDAPYSINIFCLTGFDTVRVWLQKGASLFEGRYNIGYWPWELPEWPSVWHAAYNLVDELWSSSVYTQSAFAKDAPIPVYYMPMAVSIDRLRRFPRSYFGLPNEPFLFLYVFDFNSYPKRKNFWAALKAFKKAFDPSLRLVGFVFKIMNVCPESPEWLRFRTEAARDNRIHLLENTLKREEVLGLFDACDAYVSPHRAEGFGRTLAEAMLLGKPVIATGYSGNADFLTAETGYPVGGCLIRIGADEYPYGEGLYWADPDVDQLAARMVEVYENRQEAAWIACRGKRLIEERHDPAHIGNIYLQRLRDISDDNRFE